MTPKQYSVLYGMASCNVIMYVLFSETLTPEQLVAMAWYIDTLASAFEKTL